MSIWDGFKYHMGRTLAELVLGLVAFMLLAITLAALDWWSRRKRK